MKEYDIVIGLEVHCQLKTKSKIWCNSNADYDSQLPNTCISSSTTGNAPGIPVDVGEIHVLGS